jgi:hypothetical protein
MLLADMLHQTLALSLLQAALYLRILLSVYFGNRVLFMQIFSPIFEARETVHVVFKYLSRSLHVLEFLNNLWG